MFCLAYVPLYIPPGNILHATWHERNSDENNVVCGLINQPNTAKGKDSKNVRVARFQLSMGIDMYIVCAYFEVCVLTVDFATILSIVFNINF